MDLQALVFSKNPETAQSLASILAESGIRSEICADTFAAIDKGTKQAFSCVIADWNEQPEAGFLLKRARESASNRGTVPIAIVDNEFQAKSAKETAIKFIFFRPIAIDQIRAVIKDARREMSAGAVNLRAALAQNPANDGPENPEDPNLLETAADLPESSEHQYEERPEREGRAIAEEADVDVDGLVLARTASHFWPRARNAVAIALIFGALFCVWKGRTSFMYLARTPEGAKNVVLDSLSAFFYANNSGAQPISAAGTEAQQDSYFARRSTPVAAQNSTVAVVNGQSEIPDTPHPLPKAFDFPLPSPELVIAPPPPIRHAYGKVPDSLKNSAPIGPPVVGTANPNQPLPVSTPVAQPIAATVMPAQFQPVSTPPPPIPGQIREPFDLSEQAARSLAVHIVDPVYPQEAMAQKLHGPVVVDVIIARDGSVQDVKIAKGYFVLGRAAAAAVRQWRFRPYSYNGQPLSVRTQITLSFSYPPA